jgi:hypothetical protein
VRSAKHRKRFGIHLAATNQMIDEGGSFVTRVTLKRIDLLLTQFARLQQRAWQTGRTRA